MPCSDGRDNMSRIEYQDTPYTLDRLDRVTRLLCFVLRKINVSVLHAIIECKYSNTEDNTNARDLAKWWSTHQAEDRKREAAEREKERKKKVKQQALDKLTCEERQILGL